MVGSNSGVALFPQAIRPGEVGANLLRDELHAAQGGRPARPIVLEEQHSPESTHGIVDAADLADCVLGRANDAPLDFIDVLGRIWEPAGDRIGRRYDVVRLAYLPF